MTSSTDLPIPNSFHPDWPKIAHEVTKREEKKEKGNTKWMSTIMKLWLHPPCHPPWWDGKRQWA